MFDFFKIQRRPSIIDYDSDMRSMLGKENKKFLFLEMRLSILFKQKSSLHQPFILSTSCLYLQPALFQFIGYHFLKAMAKTALILVEWVYEGVMNFSMKCF